MALTYSGSGYVLNDSPLKWLDPATSTWHAHNEIYDMYNQSGLYWALPGPWGEHGEWGTSFVTPVVGDGKFIEISGDKDVGATLLRVKKGNDVRRITVLAQRDGPAAALPLSADSSQLAIDGVDRYAPTAFAHNGDGQDFDPNLIQCTNDGIVVDVAHSGVTGGNQRVAAVVCNQSDAGEGGSGNSLGLEVSSLLACSQDVTPHGCSNWTVNHEADYTDTQDATTLSQTVPPLAAWSCAYADGLFKQVGAQTMTCNPADLATTPSAQATVGQASSAETWRALYPDSVAALGLTEAAPGLLEWQVGSGTIGASFSTNPWSETAFWVAPQGFTFSASPAAQYLDLSGSATSSSYAGVNFPFWHDSSSDLQFSYSVTLAKASSSPVYLDLNTLSGPDVRFGIENDRITFQKGWSGTCTTYATFSPPLSDGEKVDVTIRWLTDHWTYGVDHNSSTLASLSTGTSPGACAVPPSSFQLFLSASPAQSDFHIEWDDVETNLDVPDHWRGSATPMRRCQDQNPEVPYNKLPLSRTGVMYSDLAHALTYVENSATPQPHPVDLPSVPTELAAILVDIPPAGLLVESEIQATIYAPVGTVEDSCTAVKAIFGSSAKVRGFCAGAYRPTLDGTGYRFYGCDPIYEYSAGLPDDLCP